MDFEKRLDKLLAGFDNTALSISYVYTLSESQAPDFTDKITKHINQTLSRIKRNLASEKKVIQSYNDSLKEQALTWIREKKSNVEAYLNVATRLDISLKKEEYAEKHIPLRKSILPAAKQYQSTQYYGIKDSDYKEILNTIKHTGSTLERTPSSYKALHEEDLRNVLLASLNGTYKGDATGEAFRNNGKTDICIERENRAAFVAECKMWTGQKEVVSAVKQLDSYLTWRDCKTALIYFVRRKDFMKALVLAEKALNSFNSMQKVTHTDRNVFDCIFLSESNVGQQIKMQVLLFNLYCG